MGIYLFDRQTDRLTDKWVGRHIYSVVVELTDFISLSIDRLSQTVSELYMYISSVSLPLNEPYQT